MDYSMNYEKLYNRMQVNPSAKTPIRHNNFKNYSPLLPFQTRGDEDRPKYYNGFNNIIGEFARIELNKKLHNDFEINQIIFDILDNESITSSGNEEELKKLLKEYLFTNNELNILNPFLFAYIPLSKGKDKIGEKDIALFLRDIFCQNNQDLVNFFKLNKSNHAIINLIVSNITKLEDGETEVKFKSVLDNVVNVFNEDISFAIKHPDFLINNISNIFEFYYFFYISQLILKLNKDFNECVDDIEVLYYLLDWESVSKNRKTVKGFGWKLLSSKTNNLAAKIATIDQINALFDTSNYSLLGDIYTQYIELSGEDQQEFIKYLKKWINLYRNIRGLEEIDLSDDFKDLTKILFESLNDKKGIGKEIRTSRYPKNVQEFANAFFLKKHGRYMVLNITRNMLVTLTAICVKDKKIKLNQLFKEYEKRGVYFDKYSRGEIESFLTKLNLIDKKSDSGDAKYVKPVL